LKNVILIVALAMPGAALAGDRGGAEASKKGDQVLCRRLGRTGSRLASERICLTRDQWAEQRRLQREEIERAQARRGVQRDQ
jgi:hypothetical protein